MSYGLSPFASPKPSFERPVPLVFVDPADNPDYSVCFRKEWLPYITGALQQLMLQSTWNTTDQTLLAEQLERTNMLLALFMEGCGTGGNVQIEALPEGCGIRYRNSPTDEWINVETFDCVGPQGIQGIQGVQGIQGIQGEQGEQGIQGIQGIQGEQGVQGIQGEPGESGTISNPAPNPPGEPSQQLRCSVAKGVAGWAVDKFSDALDAFQAAYQIAASVEVAVSGMIDAIPIVGAFIDAAMDFGREIVEYDIVNLKACVTEEFEDYVFCQLYCELGEDGIITDAIFNQWVLGVASAPICSIGLTLVGQVMSLNMLAVGAQNYRNRGYIFSSMDTSCPPCDDCPDCFDVTLNGNNGSGVNIMLADGVNYDIEISGMITTSGGGTFPADAFYIEVSPGNWQHTGQSDPSTQYPGQPYAVLLDGVDYMTTPGFNSEHVYTINVTGEGSEVNFVFNDNNYSNNTGSFIIRVCVST